MKKLITLVSIISLSCFSQTKIEGFIYDKQSDEPLSYATVNVLNKSYYTITNENGKFQIDKKSISSKDSIEIRFIGFEIKRVSLSYFEENKKLSLNQAINKLNEIVINKELSKQYAKENKKQIVDLLYSLIRKYRKIDTIIKSKAYISLRSSARNSPIEQIEGFYNSSQNLSLGIKDLEVKSGRFSQNREFAFYSIHNTHILTDFELFRIHEQILPLYPGNMNLQSIKSKYIIEESGCNKCSANDIIISFTPKKMNGKYFSGHFLFDKKNLVVKKIELKINDPLIEALSSIVSKDVISPKYLGLNILFNPLDLEKIQSLDFAFKMNYNNGASTEYISSKSFLYFYDYGKQFNEVYYTNKIDFNNDYDKIIAQQSSTDFWKLNYQFPKSFEEQNSHIFMKKYGYMVNYSSTIPANYIKYINPSVLVWNKDKRIEWKSIKEKKQKEKKGINSYDYFYKGKVQAADQEGRSVSDSRFGKKVKRKKDEKLTFSYVVDNYKNDDENIYLTKTIFDRNSSYYNKEISRHKLIYINIIFDIYESYRQGLQSQITDTMDFDEIKILCQQKFDEATNTVKKFKSETRLGTNKQKLIFWNNKIKTKLNIDNFSLITQKI